MRLLIAGVDEAGRGPLAGPVVAAAVILDERRVPEGLADSKALTAERREALAAEIRTCALAWALGEASAAEIDRLNILQASMVAMQRAVRALERLPDKIQVDGNRCPVFECEAEAIVKGDATVPAISAASILAKVARDAMMDRLHAQYPQYEFNRHKGYPTVRHRELLKLHGPCPWHRRSYAPVAEALRGRQPA